MTLPRNKETAKIKRTANWIRLPSPNVLSLVRGRLFACHAMLPPIPPPPLRECYVANVGCVGDYDVLDHLILELL